MPIVYVFAHKRFVPALIYELCCHCYRKQSIFTVRPIILGSWELGRSGASVHSKEGMNSCCTQRFLFDLSKTFDYTDCLFQKISFKFRVGNKVRKLQIRKTGGISLTLYILLLPIFNNSSLVYNSKTQCTNYWRTTSLCVETPFLIHLEVKSCENGV